MQRSFSQFLAVAAALGLYWVSRHNYLLFHALAEGFSVVVACCIFVMAWNTRRFLANNYLLLLGIASLFVAFIDLLHTLAYRGMGVFHPGDANVPTQLWIAARYLEAISLCVAPLVLRFRLRAYPTLLLYAAVTSLLLLSIFAWRIFPDCYLEGAGGLTPFKRHSEYFICGILALAGALLIWRRAHFDGRVLQLLLASLLVAMLSEVFFTRYSTPDSPANAAGHCLKIVSFWLIYFAIVQTGLTRPYSLLLRDLKQSEERYRSLVELSPEAIAVHDGVHYLYINPAGARLFGADRPEQVVGRSVLDLVPADDRPAVRQRIDHILQQDAPTPLREVRILRLDGEPVDVEAVGAPTLYAGRPAVQVLLRDIRERLATQRRLRELAEEAQRANQAKDQFLAVLSHELRTPLAPALIASAEMARDPRLPEDAREDADMVRRSIELQTRLIDDLLDVTRIAHAKIHLHKTPLDLAWVIRQAAEISAPDLTAKRLRLVCDTRAGLHWVHADAARIQQVFWNLIKNAIKFTPDGGQIDVRCSHDAQGRIVAEVRDTGIGIAREALPRIFDAFEQVSAGRSRQFGGLGLGLAISKVLVEMHGGSITAESPGANQGATFRVTLPPAPAPAPAPASTSTAGSPAASTAAPIQNPKSKIQNDPAPYPVPRILLVEDHPDTSRMMRRLLEREGYAVSAADSVASALRIAGEQPFDIVISDLGLPDGSGLDIMRQLSQRTPRPRGIALSGYGMDEDIARSREAGFEEHLTKPVDFDRLHTLLATLLQPR